MKVRSGSRTRPADRGTEVHVDLHYDPPAGSAGAMVAKLFGEEPGQQLRDDLRRFKQVMETGEVVRSDGSLEGAGQGAAKQRPAQAAGSGGALMKATCWMGKRNVEVRDVPEPEDSEPDATRSSGLRRPPSADPISISTTGSSSR